ncbi:Uncharacterised protein [Bordetella pertussis]|nr:Uncharacterised protein [Bordetella pertussis]
MPPHQVEIVQHGDDGAAFGMLLAQQGQQHVRGRRVDRAEGLVQQQQGRVLQQQAREQRPLHLASRQGCKRPSGQFLQADATQRGVHARRLGGIETPPRADAAPGTQGHHVGYRDGN